MTVATPLHLPRSPSTCTGVKNIIPIHAARSTRVLPGAATDTFLEGRSFNEVILLLRQSTKEPVAQLEEAPWPGASNFLLLTKHVEDEGEAPAAELTQLKAGQRVPPRACISEPPGDAPVRAEHGASPLLHLRPLSREDGRAQPSPSSRQAPKFRRSR